MNRNAVELNLAVVTLNDLWIDKFGSMERNLQCNSSKKQICLTMWHSSY